jgi:hypothetical protein
MVTPLFAALYEALPVWVWAKQRLEKNRPKNSAAVKDFIKVSL